MRGILMIVGAASAGLMTSTAASAAPTLTGFDQVANGEVITIHKPLWQSGKLRVGNATGRVQRDALGRVRIAGFERASLHERSRYGRTRFEVSGSDVGGKLSGECGYNRLEERLSAGGWNASYPAEPLQMICSFARNGTPIGTMRVRSCPSSDKLVQVTTREGDVEVSGARLALRSGTAWARAACPPQTRLATGSRVRTVPSLEPLT